jgi:hypothetical protein
LAALALLPLLTAWALLLVWLLPLLLARLLPGLLLTGLVRTI